MATDAEALGWVGGEALWLIPFMNSALILLLDKILAWYNGLK